VGFVAKHLSFKAESLQEAEAFVPSAKQKGGFHMTLRLKIVWLNYTVEIVFHRKK
jgi:hypothetical protein